MINQPISDPWTSKMAWRLASIGGLGESNCSVAEHIQENGDFSAIPLAISACLYAAESIINAQWRVNSEITACDMREMRVRGELKKKESELSDFKLLYKKKCDEVATLRREVDQAIAGINRKTQLDESYLRYATSGRFPKSVSKLKGLSELPYCGDVCFIYFLSLGSKVVYVGQSTNLHGRIGSHKKTKSFDRVYLLPVKKRVMNRAEAWFIRRLQPELNIAGTTK